ncbi:MAG: ribonuclease J [Holosporales bacterium]|nr:ribonuclease J [Holosporales bacterium]
MASVKNDLIIVPIGGLEQIGGNCTMIGYKNEWIMIDLGIAFYDKLGVEVLTPDVTFPLSVRENIKGLFITHAHEDHMGAIQYLWPQLRVPVYLTEFPAAVLGQKLKECAWHDEIEIKVVNPKEPIKVGGFVVEYITMAHSILGSCGIYVKSNGGSIFHTGDWKIDEDPLLGEEIDKQRLIEIGNEGVDCLLCDSTNVLVDGETGTEAEVREALLRVMSLHKKKRITVTCFASNIARMETIFVVAKQLKRKVAVIGRSMRRMISAVAETSYFSSKFKESISSVLSEDESESMPPDKVLLLCTGSQGEARSALYKLARGENNRVGLGKQDVVLFSSKVIPGNELDIREMQNLLVSNGVTVVTTETESDIHVSGHPNRQALAQLYKWITPRTLIPIHGDKRLLHEHAEFAKTQGITEVMLADSGDRISLSDGKLTTISKKPVVLCAIDGNDLIPLDSQVIRERAIMSYNGLVSVSFVVAGTELSGEPEVIVNGIYIDEENNIKLRKIVAQIIDTELTKSRGNKHAILRGCQTSIKRLFSRHFDKKPVVNVLIHEG